MTMTGSFYGIKGAVCDVSPRPEGKKIEFFIYKSYSFFFFLYITFYFFSLKKEIST